MKGDKRRPSDRVKDCRFIKHQLGRWLYSTRLTLFSFTLLAIGACIGTVIPQGISEDRAFEIFGSFWAQAFSILGFLDVYHSWWFVLLLFILSVNMIACSLKRLPATVRLMAPRPTRWNDSLFQTLPIKERFDLKESLDDVKEWVTASFIREFRGAFPLNFKRGLALYWDRGKLSRLGPYIIHVSILLILMGALISFKWGFKGQIQLKEGEASDTIRLFGKKGNHHLGFQIRCDRFYVSFYSDGTPRDYRSYVSIFESGRFVLQKAIRVNHPLHYRGISFYQSAYGLNGIRSLLLYVKEKGKEKGDQYRVRIRERTPLKSGGGYFEVLRYVSNLNRLGPAALIKLSLADGQPEVFWVMKRYAAFDRSPRQADEIFELIDVDERYWTGLQVNQDPGHWWVWIGSSLMVVGFVFSFAMSHRRVWLLLRSHGKGTEVLVAATATKNQAGLERRILRWVQGLLQ